MEPSNIADLIATLNQQHADLETQIATLDQQLRATRERAAFTRGQLAVLSQLVVAGPIYSTGTANAAADLATG